MTENTINTTQKEIVCKGCSAKLVYKPGTQMLACQYCGSENEIEISVQVIEEQDFNAILSQAETLSEKQEVTTIKCEACGAQISFQENIASDSCAFCGNHIVLEKGTRNNLMQPKAVLPFGIDKKKSIELYKKWINGLWFAPGDLKRFAQHDNKLQAMYLPYWTYDSNTYTHYYGQRGTNHHTTESYTTIENGKSVSKTRTVTHISWQNVSGSVSNQFDDVLVVASKSLPAHYLDILEPWDLKNLQAFNPSFLSGYVTETYQIDVKEGFLLAKDKMKAKIKGTICADIGGDHQKVDSMNVSYNDITFKHILLPVYISTYKYKTKVYRFMINARTGELQGERPYSWIKIVLSILAVIAIFVLITMFV